MALFMAALWNKAGHLFLSCAYKLLMVFKKQVSRTHITIAKLTKYSSSSVSGAVVQQV